MEERKHKPTHEELIGLLSTPGWHLVAGGKAFPVKNRTLEELVRTTHARHKRGEAADLISNIETSLKLDAIQIQKLWAHMGLPM